MVTLQVPPEIRVALKRTLLDSGSREVGGVLMAEHVGHNSFIVRDLTVQSRGTRASFVRRMEEAIRGLVKFFKQVGHNYQRFNYIGEWHSHPQFIPEPSVTDDATMVALAGDSKLGAQFVVLMIVRLNSAAEITGSLHTYLPGGSKHRSRLILGE